MRIFLYCLMVLITTPVLAQEALIMTAPPRENPSEGVEQYSKLAEYIGKILGRPVEYQHPRAWLAYQRDMRHDKYDLVFDGPHFASWRMNNLDHKMVVKLPRSLQFYLVARSDDDQINDSSDLIGKSICAINPPHLSTLSILGHFSNPVRQPVIKGVSGHMKKLHNVFMSGKCDAAVFRTIFLDKALPREAAEKYKVIYTSKRMPDQVITASNRVTQEEVNKLKTALTIGKGVEATKPLVNRFARAANRFRVANNEEYQQWNLLLEGIIFGW